MSEVLSQDEIDQLLTAINAGDNDEEYFHREEKPDVRKIKIYDFKRPDKFSRDQIRTISILSEYFSRSATNMLSSMCRAMAHVHVASVDQLTYEEFIRSVPTPTLLAVINPDPLGYNWILEMDPSVVFAILDLLLGGSGEGLKYQHELTDIESSVMEGIIVRLLGNLREAWVPVLDLRPRLGQIDTNPQFSQIVAPTEMVVLVTFETKVGDVEGMINLCLPYISIESIISRLTTSYWYAKDNKHQLILDPVSTDNAVVTVKAEYFKTYKILKEINEMKSGDIIFTERGSPPFEGRIFVDNTVVGKFKIQEVHPQLNEKIKVKLTTKENYMERNHMEEKANVQFTKGLDNVRVQIIAELGRTQAALRAVSTYDEGTIIELDKLAGEPVDVFINNVLFAKAEVVVIDENFGIRLTEIISAEKKVSVDIDEKSEIAELTRN